MQFGLEEGTTYNSHLMQIPPPRSLVWRRARHTTRISCRSPLPPAPSLFNALPPAPALARLQFGLEEGTTYNSYLIFGDKTALVDASHEKFHDLYLATLQKQLDKMGESAPPLRLPPPPPYSPLPSSSFPPCFPAL